MLSTVNIAVYYQNHKKHANIYSLWAKRGVSLEFKASSQRCILAGYAQGYVSQEKDHQISGAQNKYRPFLLFP